MNKIPKFEQLLTISLLLLFPLMAQTEPDEDDPVVDEEIVSYSYHIPFPENNFLGIWHFRLELASLTGISFQAGIAGHDSSGSSVFVQETEEFGGSAMMSWESVGKAATNLQSLEVVSDQELAGVLWMWDDSLGLMNGVSLTNQTSTDLVMPYLPSDFFSWKTSFAVKGLSDNSLTGDLGFGYYVAGGVYEEKDIWQGLNDRGHLLRSPFYNIRIGELGEEPSVLWSRVRSRYPDFLITGFQTLFSRGFGQDKSKGCALELASEAVPMGWVGFTNLDGKTFTDRFVFTNPNPDPVLVLFSFQHRIEVIPELDEEPSSQVVVSTNTMEILPFASKKPDLATLFPEFEGMPVSMKYEATTVPELPAEGEEPILPQARGIFALHLQANEEGNALGGHHFAPRESRRGVAWMSMGNLFDTLVEAYNTTDRYQKLDMVVSNGSGLPIYQTSQEVAPWQVMALNSTTVHEELIALNEDREPEDRINFEGLLRVDLSMESVGRFFTKVTAAQVHDFAIVNGAMLPDEPEDEPEDPTAPTDEDEGEPTNL